MRTKEVKTIIIKVSDAELEQLALIGINSIVQTNKVLPVNNYNAEYTKRYNNILKCCAKINSDIRATIANIALSDYDKVKIVLDK